MRAPRGAGLVVELCGLPGSGKSSLTELLADRLEGCGLRVHQACASTGPTVPAPRRLARKARASLSAAVTHPAMGVRVATALLRTTPSDRRDLPHRLVQWLVTQDRLTGHRDDRRGSGRRDICLLDEGLAQALWSLSLRDEGRAVLQVLCRHPGSWPTPDVIVVLDAPVATVLERLSQRSSQHSRTQRLAEEQRRGELERGSQVLDTVIDCLMTAPSAESPVLVRVPADAPPEQLADEVARRLTDIAEHRSN